MKKSIILVFFLASSLITNAQQDCDCKKTLIELIDRVENEYPGFPEKTRDLLTYVRFKNHFLELSGKAEVDNCYEILKEYTNYFKDGHLILKNLYQNNPKQSVNSNKIELNVIEFKKYLENSKDDLEGIWISGSYEVGLIKRDNSYKAFIIESKSKSWKASEIKFEINQNYSSIYYMGDHSPKNDSCSIVKNNFIYFHDVQTIFKKKYPTTTQLSEQQEQEILNELEGFYLKQLNSKTVLLKIASFGYSHVERVNKLITENEDFLKRTENLIIDVRGNGGGTDNCYKELIPYLYTNPIRHLSGEYLVTQTLIDGLTKWSNNADKEKNAEGIKDVKDDLKRMEGKVGQYIPYSANSSFGYTEQDSVYMYPKSVAIIIDKGCGSSTENFLLKAKQSKKVKVFGVPTYGAVDYLSVREFKLQCDNYQLYMPTIRMMRLPEYPIDNIGIRPDIYMDNFVEDWIKYAQDYLENE